MFDCFGFFFFGVSICCSRSAKPHRSHSFFFIIYPCLQFIGMTHLRSIPPRACVMISSILRSVYCSTPSMLSGEMSSFFSSSIICPPQHAASASVYNKSLIDWFIELTITWLIVFAVLRPFDDILHSIININFTNILHNFGFFSFEMRSNQYVLKCDATWIAMWFFK